MSKLLVKVGSLKQLDSLLEKKIDGVILSIDKLSVNSSFYVDIDFLDSFNSKDKEVFVSLNKLMHNSDLEHLRMVMHKLKDRNVRILFYDMAVYNIAIEYGMVDKLIIYQDHLNASILSNKFYSNLGIRGSYVTTDITGDELLEIKKNSSMELFFTVYGYVPIFYSRRYLISNYLKYINGEEGNEYEILNDIGDKYPICEEEFGTTIYTKEAINLINYLNKLNDIDYVVVDGNGIECSELNGVVDKFISRDSMDNCYLGFFDTKTIYKVKKGDGSNE